MKKNPINYIYYLLTIKDRTENEIRQKCQRKEYSKSQIDDVIKKVKKQGLIDDQKFCQNFVRSKSQYQMEGKRRIRIRLIKLGVEEDIIEKELGKIDRSDEEIRADKLAKSWLIKNSGSKSKSRYQRLAGFLSRKGYSWDIVKEILDNNLNICH